MYPFNTEIDKNMTARKVSNSECFISMNRWRCSQNWCCLFCGRVDCIQIAYQWCRCVKNKKQNSTNNMPPFSIEIDKNMNARKMSNCERFVIMNRWRYSQNRCCLLCGLVDCSQIAWQWCGSMKNKKQRTRRKICTHSTQKSTKTWLHEKWVILNGLSLWIGEGTAKIDVAYCVTLWTVHKYHNSDAEVLKIKETENSTNNIYRTKYTRTK